MEALSWQQRRLLVKEKTGVRPFAQIQFLVRQSFDRSLLSEAFSGLLNRHAALQPYSQWDIVEGDGQLAGERLLRARNIVNRELAFIADVIQAEKETRIILSLSAYSADALSLDILKRQILGGLSGSVPAVEEEEISYSQFSRWQQEIMRSVTSGEAEFWQRYQRGEQLDFRFYSPSGGTTSTVYPAGKTGVLRGETIRRLRDSFPTDAEAVFACCWLAVLARHNEEKTAVIGYASNGRLYPELKNLVGPVSRIMPLTVGMPGGTRLHDSIRRVKEQIAELCAHQYAWPGEEDNTDSGFPVAFEYAVIPDSLHDGGGIELLVVNQEYHSIKLFVIDAGGSILLQLFYDEACYSQTAVEEISRQLMVMVHAAVSGTTAPWNEIPMEDAASAGQDNSDARPGTTFGSFTQTLEKICGRFPRRPAVTFNDKILDYSHLWSESERLAGMLTTEYDVKPGDKIVVAAKDTESMVCLLAAILKVGALYVPASREEADLPADGLPVSREGKFTAAAVTAWHRCLMEHVHGLRDDYGLRGVDTAALLFGAGENSQYAGIWETLLTGGTLHVVPGYLAGTPEVLAGYLVNKKVSCLFTTSHFFGSLLQDVGPAVTKLLAATGFLFFQDGRISADRLTTIWDLNDDVRIVNLYSLSGMTTPVLAHESDKARLSYYRDHWVAGRSFSGYPIVVLDDSSAHCARGITGNICAGDDKTATGLRGYWNISYELEWVVEPQQQDTHRGIGDYSTEERQKAEEAVREVWEDIFHRKGIYEEDNFFQLGGDSIKAMLIASRLQIRGYHIEVREIFLYPTITSLARAMRPALPPELADDFDAEFPMPPVYHHFFETVTFAPHHHNQSVLLSLPDTDPEILGQALEKIIDGHDALRLVMRRNSAGEWVPAIGPRMRKPEIGRSAIGPGPKGWKEIKRVTNELQGKFDLLAGPLYQFHHFTMGSEFFLFIVLHHLVTDIVSWNILIEDLEHILKMQREGSPLRLPAQGGSFGRWANYLGDYAQSSAVQEQYDHWLRIPEEVHFPKDRPDGTNYVRNLRNCSFTLDEEASGKLLGRAQDLGLSGMEALLLTALGRGLRQILDVDEVLVMMESYGRQLPGAGSPVHRTMGWFTALYPFHLEPAGRDEKAEEVCRRLQEIPSGGIGYGLLRYMGKEGKDQLRHRPNILFNYLGNHGSDHGDKASSGRLVRIVQRQSGFPEDKNEKKAYEMEVISAVHNGVFRLDLYYSGEQFPEEKLEAGIVAIRDQLTDLINKDSRDNLASAGLTFSPITREDLETFFD